MSIHREFKDHVVLWIAAPGYLNGRIYPLGFASQSYQKNTELFFIDISAELLSVENLIEFQWVPKRKAKFYHLGEPDQGLGAASGRTRAMH